MEQLKHESAVQYGVPQPPSPVNPAPLPSAAAPTAAPTPAPSRRSFPVLLAIGLAGAASATLGLFLAIMLPLPGALPPQEGQRVLGRLWRSGLRYQVSRPVTVLVMGIDRVPGATEGSEAVFNGHSDTMLLLRIDPEENSVNMLSIPRDTQVNIPGLGVAKINEANVRGGPALTRQVVSQTLNSIEIDRYVRVSTDAFRELVDLLGGIEVFVPEPMSYTDQTQKLKINLSPGWQTLNGNQAEQFARFRYDTRGSGDIGRVQRQQVLIKALRQRLTSPTVLPRLPGLVKVMQKYLDTNLSAEEILALVNQGFKLDKKDFRMVLLPGRFSAPDEFVASYWIMDPAGRDRVVQSYLRQGTASSNGASVSSLRIAIQNASGQPHTGRNFARYLESLGYSNTYLVNDWPDTEAQTQVIVQRGDLSAAKALQQALGFGSVEAVSTGDLDSDLTVRIGQDWNGKI